MAPTDAHTEAHAWPAVPVSPTASGNRVPATRRIRAQGDPALWELPCASHGNMPVWVRASSSSASETPQAENAAAVVLSATQRVENIRTCAR